MSAIDDIELFLQYAAGAKISSVGCFYQASEAGTFELAVSGDPCVVTGGSGGVVSSGFTWEADAGVSGAKYFNVARDEKSTSPSGTVFTVTFTPDEGTNTMESAANVVFVEWETETDALWPPDRRRKTIGVCEVVFIRLDPIVESLVLTNMTAGATLTFSNNKSWEYCAPYIATSDTISVFGYGPLFDFSVLSPAGYHATILRVDGTSTLGLSGSFKVYFDLTLMPTNVSFEKLQVMEVGMASTNAVGYFTEARNAWMLTHSDATGADVWVRVESGNGGVDEICVPEYEQPWTSGSMTWPIPNKYRRVDSDESGMFFCDTDQHFSIDVNGTASISKFGWSATTPTNRVCTKQRTMQ